MIFPKLTGSLCAAVVVHFKARVTNNPFVKEYGNHANPVSPDDATNPHKGTDVEVGYDPDRIINVPILIGGKVVQKNRHPLIGLAHELIHAKHMAEGDDSNSKVSSYTDLGGKIIEPEKGVFAEELRTVGIPGFIKTGDITENVIRKEQGINERARY